jgi:hypothetical protein
MNPKVVYNPGESSGQLYYIDGDLMLAFEYERYKSEDIIAINISLGFDERFIKQRDKILHFIGGEVVARQPVNSYYKITNTSIIVRKITFSHRLKSTPAQCFMAILLLIIGYFMTNRDIVLGREMEYVATFRRSPVPINGTMVIIAAIAWLFTLYFNRKKNRGAKFQSK